MCKLIFPIPVSPQYKRYIRKCHNFVVVVLLQVCINVKGDIRVIKSWYSFVLWLYPANMEFHCTLFYNERGKCTLPLCTI